MSLSEPYLPDYLGFDFGQCIRNATDQDISVFIQQARSEATTRKTEEVIKKLEYLQLNLVLRIQ